MMKLRLAKPSDLVDLGAIAELKGIREDGPDIVIGATTTQRELIASSLIASKAPILKEAAMVIADPQVRALGTIGGNVANGDPGNDMPAVMMCLGATYQLAGKGGERHVAARDFYQGAYFTALEPGEILAAIRIPVPAGWARLRLREAQAQGRRLRNRRGGGRADDGGRTARRPARSASPMSARRRFGRTPLREFWSDRRLDAATVKRAVAAAEAITSPASDTRGPAQYRTKMAGVMLTRALERARSLAHGSR